MRPDRSRLLRYAVAVAATALALALSLTVAQFANRGPASLFFAAVAVSAWYGGIGPGLLAAILGIAAIDYFLVGPRFSLQPGDAGDLVFLAILAVVAVFIGVLQGRVRNANRQAEAARAAAEAAERAERERREWWQTTVTSIGDGVIVADADGRVAFVNAVAETLTGWTNDEAHGRPVDEVFVAIEERTREPAENPAVRPLREGAIVRLANHTVLIARDGTERAIEDSGAPIANERGETIGAVLVFRDVTDRKRADAALRESAERFRAVWESASDAMALSDPNGTVVAANPAYFRLFGYRPEQVIGKSFALIFPEAHRARAAAQYGAVFEATERTPAFETNVQRADGSLTAVEARYDFVMQDGKRTAMVSIVRDISERRALERLQQEFIAMVSHDLRNPLTTIKARAQLIRRRGAYDERSVEAILTQVERQERLVNDLLEVSRIEAGGLRLECVPFDLVEEARAQAEQAQVQTDLHTIRVEAAGGPVTGTWDRDRLGRVFSNLLTNAIKYAPDGGDVLVRVEQAGEEARVSIRDRGVGIGPDVLPRLFDRFYRTPDSATSDAPGLGLGLYIVRQLVEAHGGRIWAESDGTGQGSTFVFALPLVEP